MTVTHTGPLVSIITPTFNRAPYLPGVIDSVGAQTYQNVEHIVVDGRSSDGTLAILEAAARDRGIKWISEPDDGVYDAVNKGIELSRGEIVAYLNTDDRYFPYSVDVAARFLASNDVGFVYGDVARFNESRRSGRIVFHPPFDRGRLHRGAMISQPTVFWRREVVDEIGLFDVSLRLAADIDYWNRAATVFKGAHIEEVLAWEGEHGSRLTSGQVAADEAKNELARIRAGYAPGQRPSRSTRFRDRTVLAYFYRRSVVRFALACTHSGTSSPGKRWAGFVSSSSGISISLPRLLEGIVPVPSSDGNFIFATKLPRYLEMTPRDE